MHIFHLRSVTRSYQEPSPMYEVIGVETGSITKGGSCYVGKQISHETIAKIIENGHIVVIEPYDKPRHYSELPVTVTGRRVSALKADPEKFV